MKKYLIVLSLLLLSAAFVSCERSTKDIGEAEAPAGMPEFAASVGLPQNHGVARASYVAEVAPNAGGEGGEISGEKLFGLHCGACHQATGLGVPGVFPPLDKSPYVAGDNVERLASIMIYGLMGPIKVLGKDYNSAMAGLGATLKDDELAAIGTYIRSAWSNSAGPVEVELFAKMREKWGARGPFNIQELGDEPA